MKQIYQLIRQNDGSYIDWGRNASVNGVRGEGPARHYTGEAARVMDLILKHYRGRP